MYFDSSIPQGYGIGSSGALVASIYDQYALDKITVLENLTKEKLQHLKTVFAAMESFFHGKSSGLRPFEQLFEFTYFDQFTRPYRTNGDSISKPRR